MTKSTTIARAAAPASVLIKPTAFQFKGKSAVLRNAALAGIATLAYAEGQSRAETITQLRLALGSKPTPVEVDAIKLEYIVGRVAQRLGASEFPKPDLTVVDRLAHARALILSYAQPAKDGVKSKLRAGKVGYRSVAQHKAIRASEEAWSLVKAELGIGEARTQAEKNKRQASAPGSTARGKQAPTAPTLTTAELAKGVPLPKDKGEACMTIASMSATLLAFANKHAALLPAEYGASINRFHGAIMQLEKDRQALAGTEK